MRELSNPISTVDIPIIRPVKSAKPEVVKVKLRDIREYSDPQDLDRAIKEVRKNMSTDKIADFLISRAGKQLGDFELNKIAFGNSIANAIDNKLRGIANPEFNRYHRDGARVRHVWMKALLEVHKVSYKDRLLFIANNYGVDNAIDMVLHEAWNTKKTELTSGRTDQELFDRVVEMIRTVDPQSMHVKLSDEHISKYAEHIGLNATRADITDSKARADFVFNEVVDLQSITDPVQQKSVFEALTMMDLINEVLGTDTKVVFFTTKSSVLGYVSRLQSSDSVFINLDNPIGLAKGTVAHEFMHRVINSISTFARKDLLMYTQYRSTVVEIENILPFYRDQKNLLQI